MLRSFQFPRGAAMAWSVWSPSWSSTCRRVGGIFARRVHRISRSVFWQREIIREKILNLTGEEVPYSSAVVIERFEESKMRAPMPGKPKPKPLTKISAAIFCERSGQKAILIGKGGSMLKQIGIAARKELESFLGMQVHLELFVEIADDWRGSSAFLDSLDSRNQLESLGKHQQLKDSGDE